MIVIAWAMLIIFYDIRSRIIPNYLSIGAVLLALLVLSVTGQTVTHEPISSAIIGLIIALLITIPAYAFKLLGGGDVKFLCSISLLCGVNVMIISFVIASLSLFVILIILSRLYLLNIILPLDIKVLAKRAPKEKYIPFGAAIAVGLVLTQVYPNLLLLPYSI